ncbi:MAG: hypothetical protein B7Y56_12715 [Gallionellales bacterium 35-53-114]|jgi:non-heme Fe2+,alpha-ketoglutarate-dependent halogenase|nr:MAG: hypothetical protein B7Y56_12715 [Gallionellales bacterium 35-53-114]OYZ63464.1 MAG: hypothetical protein B7Y04_08925 [Gallionellales bacterium 24-53-125]OZB10923.1 MAG: hypothetical protein B7X61_00765 [Gallionellales bacterium 39-52-133]HQS58895.1 phytanoyl-CoA dioxygenase family protein [Gallionellaceae bacterium]HQS75720.1 phytanoyl-CoA dioxygenase family protein [Gallionellaceae bacterium]
MTDVKKQNADSDVCDKLHSLKTLGFVNIGGLNILSANEVERLHELSDDLLLRFERDTRETKDYTDFKRTGVGEGAWALTRFSQHHPAITQAIDKVVSNVNIKAILTSVLGEDYKIWQIIVRRSAPGDKGLNLHQDSFGETNLVILLTDNLAGDGATMFLPESHLFSKTARALGVEVPSIIANLLRGIFKPFKGKAGNIGFFFNRTWHGRFSNTSSQNQDAILISFFPSGATFGFGGPYLEWSNEYLESISGTELGRLLDPALGTEVVGDKLYKVTPSAGDMELPYAIKIADPSVHHLKPACWSTYAVILLLRILMSSGRFVKHSMALIKSKLK